MSSENKMTFKLLSPSDVSKHTERAARSPLDLVKQHINSQLTDPNVPKVEHHAGTFYSLNPIWVPLSKADTLKLQKELLSAGWRTSLLSVRDGGICVHLDNGLNLTPGCIYDGEDLR